MPFHIDELSQRGLRLPTVDGAANMLAPMKALEDGVEVDPIGLVTQVSADLLVAIRTSDRPSRFMPSP